ncbi:MAG: hypothetical protein ACXWUM_00560 [Burkholderiaceae bacterium]
MLKSVVAAVFLFAMLWQAVAWLVPDARSRHAEQLGHLLVHTQAVNHHHLIDETLCLEAASDDRAHQHESGGVQPGILISATVADISASPPSSPTAVVRGAKPSIFLEGPLRPPRA